MKKNASNGTLGGRIGWWGLALREGGVVGVAEGLAPSERCLPPPECRARVELQLLFRNTGWFDGPLVRRRNGDLLVGSGI